MMPAKIPLDLLHRVSNIWTHGNCADGLASAMILKDAFWMLGLRPHIRFVRHNTVEHSKLGMGPPDEGLGLGLICDFAPWVPEEPGEAAERTGDLSVFADRYIVLDHHKGAKETVKLYTTHVFADEDLDPGVSGAVLAYEQVWLPAVEQYRAGLMLSDRAISPNRDARIENTFRRQDAVETFARSIGARDTWHMANGYLYEQGQHATAMLLSKPVEYWLEDGYKYEDGNQGRHPPFLAKPELDGGKALFEAHMEAVQKSTEQRIYCEVTGWSSGGERRDEVALHVFQDRATGFRMTSDVAEALRAPRPAHLKAEILAGFFYILDEVNGPPRLEYSLRTLSGDFDVSAFAKANGGGGHTRAAGFSVRIRNESGHGFVVTDPYEEVRRRLGQFLSLPPLELE